MSSQQQIDKLKSLIEELQGENPTKRVEESYSLSADAKRKARSNATPKRKRKKLVPKPKKARMKTAGEVKLAVRTEAFYPADRHPQDCRFSHDRVA